MKVRMKKVGNKLEKLTKAFHDLNGEFVEVGHFKEQGQHSDTDLTYAELMAIHHNPVGNGLNWPPRPVLDILFFKNKNLDSPEIKAILGRFRKKEPTPVNIAWLLKEIGQALGKKEKAIFGSGFLAPNSPITIAKKGRNSPLIDTGELRSKVAYRTSKDKNIKEV